MLTVLLVIQIIVAVAMVLVILLQRSSTDGLSGLGGGGGGGNSLMSGRASANALTKTTAILATVFMINSLVMASITSHSSSDAEELLNELTTQQEEALEPTVPTSE